MEDGHYNNSHPKVLIPLAIVFPLVFVYFPQYTKILIASIFGISILILISIISMFVFEILKDKKKGR